MQLLNINDFPIVREQPPTPYWEILVDALDAWLSDTVQGPHKLPTKAQLSEYYGISMGQAQTVYRTLADRRVLSISNGHGVFVHTPKIKPDSSLRTQAIKQVEEMVRAMDKEDIVSIPTMADKAGLTVSTTRSAVLALVTRGVLERVRGIGQKRALYIVK